MSKAEKFIQDCTKNCSNLMQVPTLDDKGNIVPEAHPWLTPDQARRAVEIARQETIEKVKELLLSEVLPCFMHGGEADEVVAKLEEVLNKKINSYE